MLQINIVTKVIWNSSLCRPPSFVHVNTKRCKLFLIRLKGLQAHWEVQPDFRSLAFSFWLMHQCGLLVSSLRHGTCIFARKCNAGWKRRAVNQAEILRVLQRFPNCSEKWFRNNMANNSWSGIGTEQVQSFRKILCAWKWWIAGTPFLWILGIFCFTLNEYIQIQFFTTILHSLHTEVNWYNFGKEPATSC